MGGILLIGSSLSFATEGSNYSDFLEQAFDDAIGENTVIGGESIGTDKRSVGKYLLKEKTKYTIGEGPSTEPSFVVFFTKFLLRVTMMLGVTMVIYNGVKYVVKSSKGENAKDVLMTIVYIGVGILLALFSVIIVRVLSSVGHTGVTEIYRQK